MSTSIKNLGWWKADNEYANRPNKVVLQRSDGKSIILVPDSNSNEAFALNNQYGDGSNTHIIRVFEASTNFFTSPEVVQVATLNMETPFDLVSGDLFADNSIGLVFRRASGAIVYRKVTTGTWAVGANESIVTPGNTVRQLDISVSPGGAVVVSWVETAATNPKLTLKTWVRATGGTWSGGNSVTIMGPTDPNNSMVSIAPQFGLGGSGSARPYACMVSSAQQGGADNGHEVYAGVIDEGTGVLASFSKRKTYLAGDMTTTWGTMPRRGYLFPSGGNEFTVGIMQAADKFNMLVAKFTWTGSTFTETLPPQMSKATFTGINRAHRFSASYAKGVVNFYYVADFQQGFASQVNYVARILSNGTVAFSGAFRWDDMENTTLDRLYPMAGSGHHAGSVNAQHGALIFGVNNNGLHTARIHNVKPANAPTMVTPANGTAAPSAMPEVTLRGTLGKKWPQSRHKAVWQFATDAGFTTAVRTFTQTDDKFVRIENTHVATSYAYFADTLPENLALTSGTWYMRAALVDEFGVMGTWSTPNSFTLLHPPSAINRLPNSGSILETGDVQFTWDFSDPSPTDTQSAFQIIVEENDTGAVIHDSGQQMNSLESYLISLPATHQGKLLRWKIRLWDADGSPGQYSAYETFTVAGPPTVVINSPTPGSTVNSGTPQITFTPTVTADRRIVKYLVSLFQNGELVRSSGTVAVDVPTGTLLAWRVGLPMLDDTATYTAEVMVGDETGLTAVSPQVTFTVDYVAPAASTGLFVSTADFNTDNIGRNQISWNDTGRDADFEAWVVSRKDNLRGPGGIGIVEYGEWEIIGEVRSPAGVYNFYDYYAPSGYETQYKVQQLVNRNGEYAISGDGTIVTVYPESDGYWIIVPDGDATWAFRLHNVTSDDFTDEYEETSFTIVGRGRHIDLGDHLGVTGSLTAQLRNTGDTTARQKKLQLERARATDSAVYLRNPFGDVYYVRVGNLSISRLAGVGKEEFVDVGVPYSEVAE